MAKTKKQKEEILQNLIEKIKRSKSLFFTNYNNFTVEESQNLRDQLREEKSEYMAVKKTLVDLALKECKLEGINAKEFEGPLALIFGYEDEVIGAKIIDKFKKEIPEKIDYLGGFLEGNYINQLEVKQLAKLPSKIELYAKLVGSIKAPVSGFVNILRGNLRNLVGVLKAIEEKNK